MKNASITVYEFNNNKIRVANTAKGPAFALCDLCRVFDGSSNTVVAAGALEMATGHRPQKLAADGTTMFFITLDELGAFANLKRDKIPEGFKGWFCFKFNHPLLSQEKPTTRPTDNITNPPAACQQTSEAAYKFEDHEIRVMTENGEPLFCLADVCKAMKLVDTCKVGRSICGEFSIPILKKGIVLSSNNRKLEASFLTEPQLYFVMMRGRSEVARRFRQWVCNEVLPGIRKTGTYTSKASATSEDLEALAAFREKAILAGKTTEGRIKFIKEHMPYLNEVDNIAKKYSMDKQDKYIIDRLILSAVCDIFLKTKEGVKSQEAAEFERVNKKLTRLEDCVEELRTLFKTAVLGPDPIKGGWR